MTYLLFVTTRHSPVLSIVAVGYRAVGGGLGGTVAVCVVGVHLRPEHLGCGQKATAVPHPHKKPGQFGVLAGGQVAVVRAFDEKKGLTPCRIEVSP